MISFDMVHNLNISFQVFCSMIGMLSLLSLLSNLTHHCSAAFLGKLHHIPLV